ncbi:hypothetical protein BHE97_06840 [Aeromicrobium sp. PE09-221]|nr:hypothetical protein BHE97_06840 [Aeromicrobium sp. PE09-221]
MQADAMASFSSVADTSDDGSSHTIHPEDLDVPDATFTTRDLTTFADLDEPGLEVTDRRLEPGQTPPRLHPES